MTEGKRLHIATVLRGRSMALCRCLGNIPGSQVIAEPFSLPWNNRSAELNVTHTERITSSEENTEITASGTYEATLERVKQAATSLGSGELLVVKDQILAIECYKEGLRYFIQDSDFKFLIVIRSPIAVFTSKLASDQSSIMEYFMKWDRDLGKKYYQAMLAYLNILLEELGEKSFRERVRVLNSSDIAEKPKQMITSICNWLEIPFNDSFLKWTPMGKIQVPARFTKPGLPSEMVAFPDNWSVDDFSTEVSALYGIFDCACSSSGFHIGSERNPNISVGADDEIKQQILLCNSYYTEIIQTAKDNNIYIMQDE